MQTPTDTYPSFRSRNFANEVNAWKHEENQPFKLTSVVHYLRTPARTAARRALYDRVAERLLAGSPWALSSTTVEEEDPFPPIPLKKPVFGWSAEQPLEDLPFPLLRPSSRPPPADAGRTRREFALRRKRAATVAAIIVAPFLVLATYALVRVIAA